MRPRIVALALAAPLCACAPDGSMGRDTSVRHVEPQSPREWDTRALLLEPNSEIAVAELDGKVYVIGGYPSSRITVDTVQVYGPGTDSWELAAAMPDPVNHSMAAGVDGVLYVIGGQRSADGSSPFVDTVIAYDPGADEWTPRAPMPTTRSSGGAAVVDGKIYVAGGRPPHGSDFAVYDPAMDEWTALPDIPTDRNHLSVVALGGEVWVIGGRFGAGFGSEATDAVEVFDPVAGQWRDAAPMLEPRGGLNGVVADGCIHIFGGEGSATDPQGVFPDHDVYDPRTDTWTALDPMPTPVHGVTGAAFIDGWIDLPGGGTSEGGSSGTTIHQAYRPEMSCRDGDTGTTTGTGTGSGTGDDGGSGGSGDGTQTNDDAGSSASGSGEDGGGDGSGDATGDADPSGCGCRGPSHRGGMGVLALAVLAVPRRRRRMA